jgi:quercetin dioxygenase-like cupin family protein
VNAGKAGAMTVVQPGEAPLLETAAPIRVVCRGSWTEGNVCVMEQGVPSGSLSAAHTHAAETQGAYVIEGEITFWTEGEQSTLGVGGFALRPAGSLHSVWNSSGRPARLIEITSPGENFEAFFSEFDGMLRRGETDPKDIAAMASRYGTEFDMKLTQELCQANGVSTEGSGYAPKKK